MEVAAGKSAVVPNREDSVRWFSLAGMEVRESKNSSRSRLVDKFRIVQGHPFCAAKMLLQATWESQDRERREEWRFRTPLGPGVASLEVRGRGGNLALSISVNVGERYIEPRRYCALGALVFWDVPEISGASTNVRLTAVPPEWIAASERVVSMLSRAGLRSRIVGRTLEIESKTKAPSVVLRRAGLALFALDAFSRSAVPRTQFEAIRYASIKAFKDAGSELLELLDDAGGERALRSLFAVRPDGMTRRTPTARPVMSDEHAPEFLTAAGRSIRVEQHQWKATFDAFSRWTVNPRWLIYVPPGMCSLQSQLTEGPLEHPRDAFNYYRNENIKRVIVELKHMGSRAIVVVCRDEAAAMRRFGVNELGAVYTRSGRPFFEDPRQVLSSLRDGLDRAQFWKSFNTDWVCLDGEYLPWTLKAEKLIKQTHEEVLGSGQALIREMRAASRLLPDSEVSKITDREECFKKYGALLDHYGAETGTTPLFAPFQIIATEGQSYFNRGHKWHMQMLHSIVRKAGREPFVRTPYMEVRFADKQSVEKCFQWWEELAQAGAEGLVIKAPCCVPKGRRGTAQPAIKCRTPEHLRLVYGPEYDLIENRWVLANRDAVNRRREKHRRVLKQLVLSIDGIERFIRGEPNGQIENCVRSVLSLEK